MSNDAARIFRSDEGRRRLEEWYDRFVARVRVPVEHREVATTHGASHVLVVGDTARPPLVCLHGALASSAHAASELGPLAERFHIYLPDLPGQSVRGPLTRLPLKDDSLAAWLLEVFDGLGLDSVNLYGISLGGFVARKAAVFAPQRVRKLVLLVPAGFVNGSFWKGFSQIMWPMTMYRWFPSEERLSRFVEPLFSTMEPDWVHYMGDAVRDIRMDLRIPPLAKPKMFNGFTTPTLVFGGDQDLSFPGDKLLARAKELIPHAEIELIPNCKHCPPNTDEFRSWIADRITKFLG